MHRGKQISCTLFGSELRKVQAEQDVPSALKRQLLRGMMPLALPANCARQSMGDLSRLGVQALDAQEVLSATPGLAGDAEREQRSGGERSQCTLRVAIRVKMPKQFNIRAIMRDINWRRLWPRVVKSVFRLALGHAVHYACLKISVSPFSRRSNVGSRLKTAK